VGYPELVTRARGFALLLGLSLMLLSLGAGALRAEALLKAELQHEGPWLSLAQRANDRGATRISARLAEVSLRAGEDATFEICAQGDLASSPWQGALSFVVWREREQKLELKVPLDTAHRHLVRQKGDHSCLTLGGGRIEKAGRYALDAIWPDGALSPPVARLSLRARVLGKRPLGLYEGLLVFGAAFGSVLAVLSAFSHVQGSASTTRPSAALWALALGVLGAALFQALLRVPLPFVGADVARGLVVAAVEVALALLGAKYAFSRRRAGLCLLAPEQRPALWLLAAAALALLLRMGSHYCLRLVPSTAEAPIETFISWPSGALSFALVGMAAPLAEELFFRGFVFGALRRLGTTAACLGSGALFVLAHVQQVWGNWGALSSLVLTAVTLTGLRALSGSTLVPALAHLLFNLSLWSASFRG
jgi:membrane protease YdiL (CAAX protease family)